MCLPRCIIQDTLSGVCCIQTLSGMSVNSENGRNMAEISLICEENLLDTIFHACDTQRRGTPAHTLTWDVFSGSSVACQT